MAQTAKIQLPEVFGGLFHPYRYKVFYGGRGGGKSHSFATALLILGYQKKLRILCTREIQKSITASVKQLLEDKIDALGLRWFYNSTQTGIVGANGTQFLFAGLRSNPESIKSMEGIDIVWIEEADRISASSWTLLTPTVRAEGSQVWLSFNRQNTSDPIDNMFLGGEPPPKTIIQKVTWRDNPWFPSVLKDEMEWLKKRDYDKYLHVWEGEPLSRSDSKVFTNWRVDDIDGEIPDDVPLRYGADWGFSIDPSVLVGAKIHDRTLYVRHEAWKVKCPIDQLPALFAGDDDRDPPKWSNPQRFPGCPDARRTKIVADSARPETIAYLRARDFNIHSAIKGARSVEEGVEFLQSFDIVIHPSCLHVIDEVSMYEYKIDPLTDEVLPELADKNNHTIDALRYALEQMRKKGLAGPAGIAPDGMLGPRLVEG